MDIWLYPSLSTTREFPELSGNNLAETVLKRIEYPDQKPQMITIPTEFIRRDSCMPPTYESGNTYGAKR